MPLSSADFSAIWLTIKLASLTTVILLIIGTPIALWLSRTRSWWRGPIGAIVALPLVLPPTVIGFYLLLTMGPNGYFGQFTQWLGLGTLTFSFAGLVKEREVPDSTKFESVKEFSLAKGALVALISGVLSACFSYGIAAGQPLAEAAIAHGANSL